MISREAVFALAKALEGVPILGALEGSAEILQELSDAEARRLAQELAALRAALPKLGGPPRPFVDRLARAVAS